LTDVLIFLPHLFRAANLRWETVDVKSVRIKIMKKLLEDAILIKNFYL